MRSVPRFKDSPVTILMVHWEGGKDETKKSLRLSWWSNCVSRPFLFYVSRMSVAINAPLVPKETEKTEQKAQVVNDPVTTKKKRTRNERKNDQSQRARESPNYVKIPDDFKGWTQEAKSQWFKNQPLETPWTRGQKKLKKEAGKEARDSITTVSKSPINSALISEEVLITSPLTIIPAPETVTSLRNYSDTVTSEPSCQRSSEDTPTYVYVQDVGSEGYGEELLFKFPTEVPTHPTKIPSVPNIRRRISAVRTIASVRAAYPVPITRPVEMVKLAAPESVTRRPILFENHVSEMFFLDAIAERQARRPHVARPPKSSARENQSNRTSSWVASIAGVKR